MRKSRMVIYQSRVHLAVTLWLVILPFLFLLASAQYAHIETGKLFSDLFISLIRLAVAFVIAVVFAWICAVLFYRGERAAIALPIFDVLQSFPTFALLPIVTLIGGPSNSVVIFFLVITVVWPLFFSIISSLKLTKPDWEEAIEIMNLDGRAYLKYYLLPISIPGLITGSIIGLGEGWEALVATEIIVGIPEGLGNFFKTYTSSPVITALGIFGLLLLIFSINKLIWLPLLEWSHKKMEE